MTAELLVHNIAAHWMQACVVAVAAWLGVTVLRLRDCGLLLKYWLAVLFLLLLAPWIQPWQPVVATPANGAPALAGMAGKIADGAGVPVAGSVIALPAERGSVDPWAWVLGLLAAGVLVRLAWLGLGLARLRGLARAAHRVAPPDSARGLPRFPTSAAFVQRPDVGMPCSFGLFRPTVVLPAVFDRLEPEFQRGIVCHELLHLERRDFVAAVVEEVVAAFLWFHPWVWLIRRRIRLHREQVVDAAVVRRTGDRRAYVRCLLALAGHPRALPLAAPMLRSTELRARTDALFEKEATMSERRSTALAIGMGAALGAAVWAAGATVPLRAAAPGSGASVLARTVAALVAEAQRDDSSFEAASVSESAPGRGMRFRAGPDGRLQIRGHHLRWLVARAHGVDFRRVLEGPDWSDGPRFDIEATLPGARPVDESSLQAMLRNLLADRFALRVRVEEREMPHYALVLANPGGELGDGIRPSTTDCDAWRAGLEREGPPTAPFPAGTHCSMRFTLRNGSMSMDLGARTMAELATVLQAPAAGVVKDETGLAGRFDIGLEFLEFGRFFPDSSEAGRAVADAVAALASRSGLAEGLSVFEAVEQQLGLRLESRQGPVRMIVVEHAERPSPN